MRIGAGNEIRTRDLNLGKVALYQLSYSRLENDLFYSTELWSQCAQMARLAKCLDSTSKIHQHRPDGQRRRKI